MPTVIEVNPLAGASGAQAQAVEVPDTLASLTVGAPVPPDCGVFRVLTQKDGDKRVCWNRRSLAEINEAKSLFNSLVAQGMKPYRVGPGGKGTAIMAAFDPMAEEIVFLPESRIVGG